MQYSNPILMETRDLSVKFGGLMALDGVSFGVPKGTICGLIGPNGAGKTTLLNVISGLIPLTSGSIMLEGEPINHLAPNAVAKRGIGRTFQNIRLFGDFSVLDNVVMGYHLRQRGTLLETLLQMPRSRKDRSAAISEGRELLKSLGMDHFADKPARSLSYGDQRRVEIARALALNPKLLLLDEPAAGMNSSETDQLSEFLLRFKGTSLTIFIIEHDMDLIMRISDHIFVLNFGMKIAEGSPQEIRQNQQVIEAYLGSE